MKDLILDGKRLRLRLLQSKDKDLYWQALSKADAEVICYTGATETFSKEVVYAYVDRNVADETRYDFLVFQAQQLVGEVVLNDIDTDSRHASFRICLFGTRNLNQGIGTEATGLVLRFAFEELGLHRVELEVFDYNPRAKHMYEKVGFVQEGIKRDAMRIDGEYHDVIIMSILETEYH